MKPVAKKYMLVGALALITSGALSQTVLAQESLREAREAAEQRDQARLLELVNDQEALTAALDEAEADHARAEETFAALQEQQAEQMEVASELSSRQSEQDASLADLLADLSRHSAEIRNALGEDSWLTLDPEALPPRLEQAEVLERGQLETVVDTLARLTAQTGEALRLERDVAEANGEIERETLVRLGDFAAFTDSALLTRRDGGELAVLPRTPREIERLLGDFVSGESRVMAIDPTQGTVIAALGQRPSLIERFHQGGYVGYVIVALGVIGLLVALAQYLYLVGVSGRVKRQSRSGAALRDNNPLGRVLLRFEGLDKHQSPEALEARMDEAVLAELPKLERGQPLVKLTAAIAPLLGLLGTVTGMIVTFQAITVFGTGDPQLMAGGISQALVTTVLGLITAVPLLFAQTALASRSRYLTQVIEGQASATLADHLESQSAQLAPTAG
ncbi:MotA/TolQ/ExbB proton channel family protein [Halomonas sp. wenzhen-202101]|uniref:MotA/TolQ/ExbB proton channel family protein n=2 Tax=Halomonas dongshanensis TaxID=2890835 RepID=A0ABT2EF24_9GAMM|nr:MotA/TolQ/ExbB proton channel family protein [Halomonas dongshanensis]